MWKVCRNVADMQLLDTKNDGLPGKTSIISNTCISSNIMPYCGHAKRNGAKAKGGKAEP